MKKTSPVSSATGTSDATAANLLLQALFSVIILIVMFLCFFALSTNMTANLYEQSKEIGILRSIGFTNTRIKILFFYEAFVLVFVSCLMGILIGTMVGYTMMLQQEIMLGVPLAFVFPSL